MAVFVVKTIDDYGQPIPGIFHELQAGRARIGWSSGDNQDLRLVQRKKELGEPLDENELRSERCLGFLMRVNLEDYLIYPHQPARRWFCVVRVEGEHAYSSTNDGIGGDFRSYRHCVPVTPEPVDMYDDIVPSQLRQRLGLQGRFYQIRDDTPFLVFMEDLPNAGHQQDGSTRVQMRRIHNELRRHVPDAVRREFTRADLSRQFCVHLFDRMGYTVEVQEGPAEAGSDIVVTLTNPLLPREFRIGVQVFSYEGVVEEPALGQKLDQLLEGWEGNALDYGVLLTTGRGSDDAKAALARHNMARPNRQVRLIDGDDLADLFLKHFPPEMD